MVWCDKNENVLQWGSEEIVIPYISPVDRRVHRYFPDFYVKAKTRDERIKKYIVEVKYTLENSFIYICCLCRCTVPQWKFMPLHRTLASRQSNVNNA